MLMTRVNPFNELKTMRDILNLPTINTVDSFIPKVNTRESDEAYHIEIELPGMSKEDITIEVDKGLLSITGKREYRNELKEEDYYKIESNYGKFYRSFTLPEDVDVEKISASSNNGVLDVTVPKAEVVETKKLISIS